MMLHSSRCLFRAFVLIKIFTLIVVWLSYAGRLERVTWLFKKDRSLTGSHKSVIKNGEASDNRLPKCKDFAKNVVKGFWRERPGLTKKDYDDRRIMDEEIRLRMDWPKNLFRNDSRCGKKFPIPGYRIQSMCNPEGSTPCCNVKNGVCGASEYHCHCPECTDLRVFKSAELLEWITEDYDCRLKNFTTKEACDFLNGRRINLLFIGDSLIRHLSTTMILLLSGDPLFGALPANASKPELQKCRGEFQLTDKDCSIYLTAHSTADVKNGSICQGKTNFVVSSSQVYMNKITDDALARTKELLGVPNSYVIVGAGMHFRLNVDSVLKDFLEVLLGLISKRGSGWPKLIWMELHNIDGFLRMDTKFLNNGIDKFNKKISKYLESKNVIIIRTFEMSKTIKSYDGQHYGIGFNFFKIQLILNYLDRLKGAVF